MLKFILASFFAFVLVNFLLPVAVHCSQKVDGNQSIKDYDDLTHHLVDLPPAVNNRTKRSGDRYVWHLHVVLQNGTKVSLNLVQVDNFLANVKTPLWKSRGHRNGKVGYARSSETLGDRVGTFSFWQDTKAEAAVVLFHNDGLILGHVEWERFKLKSRPRSTRAARPDVNLLETENSLDEEVAEESASSSQSEAPPPETVYPEILLVLDYKYLDDDEAIPKALAWWNWADALYRPITKPNIRLNIGGIVLAENDRTNPWVAKVYNAKENTFDPSEGIRVAGSFYAKQKGLPDYDIVVSYVKTPMHTTTGTWVGGVSNVGSSCRVKARRVILVSYTIAPSNVNVHELGHALGSHHDTAYKGCENSGMMMSPGAQKTYTGLRWSHCSVQAIRNFLRKSSSSCYANCPRTNGVKCP